MSAVEKVHIHLSADSYVRPGEIHLSAAYADFKEIEDFLSKHFITCSYTHDEIGFPVRYFECPRGSKFMRNKDGGLISDLDELTGQSPE